MGEVFLFTPAKELDASENLTHFIKFCREKLTHFGRELIWEAEEWDLTDFADKNGSQDKEILRWTNFDSARSLRGGLLLQPFLDFARAYIRYQHGFRKLKNSYGGRLTALRALERALVSQTGAAHPKMITASVFADATELIKTRYAKSAHVVLCSQLELIASLLAELRLTSAPLFWKNPFPANPEYRYRTGMRLKTLSEALPSEMAIDAITSIFATSNSAPDVITSSLAAILMSQSGRIDEVLALPANCEEGIDRKGKINHASYRLRWYGAKKFGWTTKEIPSVMVDVVHSAVTKLKSLGEEGRAMAAWYENEKNHGKIYLPKDLEELRGKDLSEAEMAQILGNKRAEFWRKKVEKYQIEGAAYSKGEASTLYRFASFEKLVLRMLPRNLSVLHKGMGLKFSEALFVFPKGIMGLNQGTSRCMFEVISKGQISKQLGGGMAAGSETNSIFSRNGFTEDGPEHRPIKVETHSFRRWYDTMMERNGFTELEIALNAGRANINHNSAYKYVPIEEYFQQIANQLHGTRRPEVNTPVTLEDAKMLLKSDLTAVHYTEFGFCVHDFAARPCEKLVDCINCYDQICVKGFTDEDRLRASHCHNGFLLDRAKQAVDEEYYGADAWVMHQETTVAKQANLIECLEHPDCKNGEVFRLSAEGTYSKIGTTMDQRRRLDDRESQILDKFLAERGIQKLDQLPATAQIGA